MTVIDGGRLLARALRKQGITHVFTLCGGHILPAYQGCIDENIKLVDFRHEQSAAFAAEGWAKVTGRAGVCLATAGPGVPNTVTAVANAFNNSTPLIVIGAGNAISGEETGQSQQLEHCRYMAPITRFTHRVSEASRIPAALAKAFKAAETSPRGPSFLEIPSDLLLQSIDYWGKYIVTSREADKKHSIDHALVEKTAELLRNAERPVIVSGSSVWWCGAASLLKGLAELAMAPVYLMSLARGSLPASHPLCFSLSRHFALDNADLIIVIGTPIDFRLDFGKEFNSRARLIHLDSDGGAIGQNRAVDVSMAGDLTEILKAVYAEDGFLKNRTSAWLKTLREKETMLKAGYSCFFESDAVPVHPLRLCREIDSFIGGDATIVMDGGNFVRFAAHILHTDRPGKWLDPGPMGTLGAGMGYAIAAKLANPRERVLIVHGDGAFGMGAMEFDTMARHNLPVVSIIGNDSGWGQVKQVQCRLKHRGAAVELAKNTRYDKLVESLEGYGEFVTSPGQIRPALERAFASGKPACVNVMIDSSVFYESIR